MYDTVGYCKEVNGSLQQLGKVLGFNRITLSKEQTMLELSEGWGTGECLGGCYNSPHKTAQVKYLCHVN